MGLRAKLLFFLTLAACDPEPRLVRLELAMSDALPCRPTRVDTLEVRALGDFPTREPNVLVFGPEEGLQHIERFPDDTVLLTVEGRGVIGPDPWIGGGVAGVVVGEARVLLLPYGSACALADPLARFPDGAAIAALPDGRVWIAGGAGQGVLTVRPGALLAEQSSLRLFVPRTHATATVTGDGIVLVAGGAGSSDGEAYDSYELMNVTEGQEEPIGNGFMLRARRDHAAIALGAGRVLVAGGRASQTEALADAEIVGEGSASVGPLARPRAEHQLVRRDDGEIFAVGGVDAAGAAIGAIERFDGEGFEELAEGFPARLGSAHAAIVGGRVLQVGGHDGSAWTGEVELLLESGEIVSLGSVVPALEAPRVVALDDGRVVVIGTDVVSRRARGVIFDPGIAEAIDIEASRAPSALVRFIDGSIAEGDVSGLSLLRVDLRTPLDAPQGTLFFSLTEDRSALALDAPGRWRASAGGLVADVDGARADLRSLLFADFTAELDAEGPLELLLGNDAIAIGDTVRIGSCATPRERPITIARSEGRVTIGACTLDLQGRVGIGVRALTDTTIRSLFITRE